MKARLKTFVLTGACCAALASPVVASAAAPAVDAQWVAGVTSTKATLHAEINPNGLEAKYMLQLDTTGKFKFHQNDGCVLHPPGTFCTMAIVEGDPLPPGLVQPTEHTLDASNDSQHVSVSMASIGATLQPNTTYHYRAIAANSKGFTFGQAQTFTTPTTPEPSSKRVTKKSRRHRRISRLTWIQARAEALQRQLTLSPRRSTADKGLQARRSAAGESRAASKGKLFTTDQEAALAANAGDRQGPERSRPCVQGGEEPLAVG